MNDERPWRKLKAIDKFLNGHTWVLPTIAITLMLIIFGFVLGTLGKIGDIQTGQRTDDLATCERGNASRASSVRNLRGDRKNLRGDRKNLEGDIEFILSVAPISTEREKIIANKRVRIAEKIAAIDRKTTALETTIDAQAEYAVKPGSPRINCDEANSTTN